MLKGLDVSTFQGFISDDVWEHLRQTVGCSFVIIKAADGSDPRPDDQCARNVAAARRHGFVVGGYSVIHPFPALDPVDQARRHFEIAVSCGLNAVGDLPFAFDLEEPDPAHWPAFGCTPTQIRGWSKHYLETSESLWGLPPLVYSFPHYFDLIDVASEPAFAKYYLWAASYRGTTFPTSGAPRISVAHPNLTPWTSWTFWQWCDDGRLPNGSKVDFNVYNGDDLSRIVKQPASVASLNPLFVPPDDDNT
jgi:GH25 family lysozyme M1 (1,4-beta-N-acetylmuramidase)